MNNQGSAGCPLSSDEYPKCQKLLEGIEADPGCEPFLMPVAWEGKCTLF